MKQSQMTWKQRVQFGKGALSESKFLEWAEARDYVCIDIGMKLSEEQDKKVNKYMLSRLSKHTRMAPDYACLGKKESFLVEVKGCGREGAKIKDETMSSLALWQEYDDVRFFIYNSSSKKGTLLTLAEMATLCEGATRHQFDVDKKWYSLIPVNKLTWEPIQGV